MSHINEFLGQFDRSKERYRGAEVVQLVACEKRDGVVSKSVLWQANMVSFCDQSETRKALMCANGHVEQVVDQAVDTFDAQAAASIADRLEKQGFLEWFDESHESALRQLRSMKATELMRWVMATAFLESEVADTISECKFKVANELREMRMYSLQAHFALGYRLECNREDVLVLTQRKPDKYLPEGQSLALVHWLADSVDSPLEQRDGQWTALKGSVSLDINSDTVFAETFDNIYAVDTEQSSVIFQ